MNIFITGGTGLIGRRLCRALLDQGHTVTVLSRKPDQVKMLCGEEVTSFSTLEQWTDEHHFNVVINLAGEPIVASRWTSKRKQQLWDSRVTLTQQLTKRIDSVPNKPALLISGSAIGIYGDTGEKLIDENASSGDDFGAQLCLAWEVAAQDVTRHGIRLCLLRTGLVLDNAGGILGKMYIPFSLGLGSQLGRGKQWMSWIHYQDYIAIVLQLMNDPQAQGIFNMTAPQAVTNAQFTQSLAKALHRRSFLKIPAVLLQPLLGEMAQLLLGGQRALPQRLMQLGYAFHYTTLDDALHNLYRY